MDEAPAQPTGMGTRFARWITSFEDGKLLRAIFFGLLIGTIGVLIVDYVELSQATVTPAYSPSATPILPAVDRPEIDPDSPAFAPQTHLTANPETLGAPMEISLQPGGILKLEGTIALGTAEAFSTELQTRGEYVKIITLNSPGGSVSDALAMGQLIRENGKTTSVAAGALCASSCPLIFAGGTKRLANTEAAIGVHQIYAADAQIPGPAQAMSDAQTTTAIITRYLASMNVDPGLWLHALDTPPAKLYYFTGKELTDLKLATKIE